MEIEVSAFGRVGCCAGTRVMGCGYQMGALLGYIDRKSYGVYRRFYLADVPEIQR